MNESLAARVRRYFDHADLISDGIAAAEQERDDLKIVRNELLTFQGAVRHALIDIATEIERLSEQIDREGH